MFKGLGKARLPSPLTFLLRQQQQRYSHGHHSSASPDLQQARAFLQELANITTDPPKHTTNLNLPTIECQPDPHCPSILHLRLQNPRRHNALTPNMMLQLEQHLDRMETALLSSDRPLWGVLVVSGVGPRIACIDLSVARHHLTTAQAGMHMCTFMQHTLQRLQALPLLTVAAIHGNALGGGAELSTACDVRLLSNHPSTRVQFVQRKMGVTPGWGGGTRLTAMVGRSHALRLLCGMHALGAKEAMDMGFAQHLVDVPERLLADEEDRHWAVEALQHLYALPVPGARASTSPNNAKDKQQATTTDLEEDMHVFRQLKSIVHQADANTNTTTAGSSLQLEKQVFASVWGAPLNQRALLSKK